MSATKNEKKHADVIALRQESGLVMEWADAERFLAEWTDKGRSADTVNRYRHALEVLYQALPEDKTIRRGTLAEWQDELLESGYSNASVNVFLSASDSFLAFMGCRELQVGKRMAKDEKLQPELTRSEYLRMLTTAKSMGDERLYLLVKTIGSTGLRLNELSEMTIANIKAGKFVVTFQGVRRLVHMPNCLVQELLAFAERQGIQDGLVFRNERGGPLHRSYITVLISKLCRAAEIPEEKGNPKALRRLYLATWDNILSNMQVLMEQTMDRQIEEEQFLVGWEM